MINMLIRSLIVYMVVFAAIRLMGKRQIGEMQPFELVITLILADLACIPMAELAVPLSHGLIPIFVLLILHYFISLMSRKSTFIRHVFSGRPSILISPKGIHFETLKKLNMNLDDLWESIRGCEFFNFEDIAYAIIETNGKMCVIPRKQSAPLTCGDMKITKPQTTLPMSLVMDGKLQKTNLKITGTDNSFIFDCLREAKIEKVKDVLIFTLDNNGYVYIQPKKGDFRAFQTKFASGERW